MENENAVQAVVLMDTFNNNFDPITSYSPMGLFAVAGVPLIIYLLESLALGGVNKAILFCCNDGVEIKEYLRTAKEQRAPWSLSLDAQVLMSETCQTMGDVMREIDAAGLINGYFVLTSINNIANIPYASMLEQHKALTKKDKGAAITFVYKQVSWEHPLISADEAIFLEADKNTRKVLTYKTYKLKSKDDTNVLPLESVINHSEVTQLNNLLDANIALCSPSVLSLFSDHFDYQTRDDFINGVLGNEEIMASSLYYTLLKDNMYAATVTNRRTYKTISRDIILQSALPLFIKSGSLYQDNYELVGNNTFCHKTAKLSRSCSFKNSQIGPNAQIGANTVITNSIIGANARIGNNVVIMGSRIGNNVIVRDNARVINRVISDNAIVTRGWDWDLEIGTIITSNVNLSPKTEYKATVVEDSLESNAKTLGKSTSENRTERENESTGKEEDAAICFEKTESDNYEIIGNNTFYHKTATLSRSCSLEQARIGAHTQIGANTIISNSVIGANCVIGRNVVIAGSHIASNVVIRDNCKIFNSIVYANSRLQAYCLLGDAIIGANTNINVDTIIDKSQTGANCVIGRYVTLAGSSIGHNVIIRNNAIVINRNIGHNSVVSRGMDLEIGTILTSNVFSTGTKYKGIVAESGLESNEKTLGESTSEIGTEKENETTGGETDEAISFDKTESDNYEFIGNNTLCHKTAKLSGSCSLKNSQIGANAQIGANTVITNSIIGANAIIGNNVVIMGSRIGNNVIVRDNARVINRVIGDNAILTRGWDLEIGTILPSNVYLSPETEYKATVVKGVLESKDKTLGKSTSGSGTEKENVSTGKKADEAIAFEQTESDNYQFIGNDTFCHKTVKLSRSCLLKRAQVGANTQIGANTIITNSVVGANCVIGRNVVITGSHIASNTVIKDNCKIINSIVNANSVLQVHCLLEDVVILANTEINVYTIINKSQIGANCVVGRYVTITGSSIGNNVVIRDNARVINRNVGNNSVVSRSGDLNTILTSCINLTTGTKYKGAVVESDLESNENIVGESISEIGTERETKTTGSDEHEAIGFEKTSKV